MGLSAGTVITKKTRIQTIEFPWGIYCLVVLFPLLYVFYDSVPTEGTEEMYRFHSRGLLDANLLEKRKRLHKKRVQLPQNWFETPTWPSFHCFGTPIWPP